MEKWENDLKDFVNDELPEKVEKSIHTAFQQIPRKKKKSPLLYPVIAALVTISILIGGSFLSPAFADTMKSLPIFGSLFDKFGDDGIKQADEKGLGTPINEVVTIEGKTVTFTKYIYDGSRVALEFQVDPYESIHPEDKRPYDIFGLVNRFFVNGELLLNPKMDINSTKMSDGSYVGVLTLSPDESLPRKFHLRFRSDFTWEKEGGQINIKRNIESKTIAINETFKNEDLSVTFDKLSISPLTTTLYYQAKIKDDLPWHLEYQLIDSKGKILSEISTGSSAPVYDGYAHFDTKQLYNPTEFNQTFTIRPYLIPQTMYSNSRKYFSQKWAGEPITMSQGDLGDVKVTDVVQNGNEVKVTIQALGEIPHLQKNVYVSHTDSPDFYGYHHVSDIYYIDGIPHFTLTVKGYPEQGDFHIITTKPDDGPIILNDFKVTVPTK